MIEDASYLIGVLSLNIIMINQYNYWFLYFPGWTIQHLIYGPFTRYVKLRVAHAPVMPGTFFPPPQVSDPDMHHGTCVTHVLWCMLGSLVNGFLWSRWGEKRSRHSWRMRNPQFYLSDKGPCVIAILLAVFCVGSGYTNGQHSVESPSMVDPQWNIWYWGSKWNLYTVCWSAVGYEWGTTSVYFGITYVCFIPTRLLVFAVELQYLLQYFLFLSKVSFELHIQNRQKISCWFKIGMGFVGPILIKLWTSSIWGFL